MKKGLAVFAAVMLLFVTGCLEKGGSIKGITPKTDEEKTIYNMGQMESRRLKNFDLSDRDLMVWLKGIKDGLSKEVKVDMQSLSKNVQKLSDTRSKRIAAREKKAGAPYMEKMKSEDGAVALESGVIYRDVQVGEGNSPEKESIVKVHYHGTLRDGTVFDSSVDRGSPATFPLNKVIPCWTEAVQKMKVGGKAKVTCPSDTAYGDRGAPPKIAPGASLTFDVELLEIVEKDKEEDKKS